MDEREVRDMMGDISAVMKSLVSTATAPILARLDALEARLNAMPIPKDGRDGKDADVESLVTFIEGRMGEQIRMSLTQFKAQEIPDIPAIVADAINALPLPKDGRDGKDADPNEVAAILTPELDNLWGMIDAIPLPVLPDIPAMVEAAVAATEKPKDGHSPSPDELRPLIEECVSRAVAGLPVPKDGVNLAGALIDRDGNLVLTLSDGTVKQLGPVVGNDGADGQPGKDGVDGAPGKDGVDGLGFDDFDVVIDEERGVFLRISRGDVVKEFRLPVVMDRGVFKEGAAYDRGDGVTWGGCFWIAKETTTEKPQPNGGAWRLAVKKGRDGRDGKDGTAPAPVKVKV